MAVAFVHSLVARTKRELWERVCRVRPKPISAEMLGLMLGLSILGGVWKC